MPQPDNSEVYSIQSSPLLRLPVELLGHIIYLLASDYDRSALDRYPVAISSLTWHRPWIIITHVCRTTREISLNLRALWNKIYITHEITWVDDLVRRARTLPLELILEGYGPVGMTQARTAALTALARHFVNSSKVDIYDYHGSDGLNILFPVLGSPAPLLTRFTYARINTFPRNADQWLLNFPLFANHAPNLANLWIEKVTFNRDIFDAPMHSITSLTLIDVDFLHPYRSDCAVLLDLLGMLPSLESLHIVILDFDNESDSPQALVDLKRLKNLQLTSHYPEYCNPILGGISLPAENMSIVLGSIESDPILTQIVQRMCLFWDFVQHVGDNNVVSFATQDRDDPDDSDYVLRLERRGAPECGLALVIEQVDHTDIDIISRTFSEQFCFEEVTVQTGRDLEHGNAVGFLSRCRKLTLDMTRSLDILAYLTGVDFKLSGGHLKHLVIIHDTLNYSANWDALTSWLTTMNDTGCSLQTLVIEAKANKFHQSQESLEAYMASWRALVSDVTLHLTPPDGVAIL
jgi:hypothetical protein